MKFADNDVQTIFAIADIDGDNVPNMFDNAPLLYNPDQVFNAFISVDSEDMPDVIQQIFGVYTKFEPSYTFDYAFIEDQYNASYSEVITVGRLSNLFSVAAIFISCLGLFGLSAFITEQRKKETGIRKVLGASEFSLLRLFSARFMKLVLLAFVIATPVAWFYSSSWLADYAYQIELNMIPFLIAGVLALLIALLTVSYSTLRAANSNPVDTLKTV